MRRRLPLTIPPDGVANQAEVPAVESASDIVVYPLGRHSLWQLNFQIPPQPWPLGGDKLLVNARYLYRLALVCGRAGGRGAPCHATATAARGDADLAGGYVGTVK